MQINNAIEKLTTLQKSQLVQTIEISTCRSNLPSDISVEEREKERKKKWRTRVWVGST